MSRNDFERCVPSEFIRIYESWAENETRLSREGWERIRTLAAFIIPVYRPKKTIQQLLPFPWDKKEKATPKGSSSMERMREIAARVTRK